MSNEPQEPDPAAVCACVLSLWQECKKAVKSDSRLNLSECYNGMDEFMRVLMRAATRFEAWACQHIVWGQLDDVWPYVLEDRFGAACLAVMFPTSLAQFDDTDCLRVALHLDLPVRVDTNLPVPVEVTARNPIVNSGYRVFQILTVRNSNEGDCCEPFIQEDDPFDEQYSVPFFGLYGVGDDGLREHIADRATYADAVALARKLAPGISFPAVPCSYHSWEPSE